MVNVDPGLYTVRLTTRGMELDQTVLVIPDKRRQADRERE
jgi:hypothetical protein